MKRIGLMALVSGLAIAAASPANAAIVISYSVNGGALTQLSNDAATPGSAGFVGSAGNFFLNVGATGAPLTNPFDLLTQSIAIQNGQGTAGTLSLFFTETGLPSLNGALQSSFTSNIQTNAVARITSYYSPTNTANGGTQLQTALFNNIGTFMGNNLVNVAGPFSTTVRYDLTFGNGAGNFNGTANLTAVPEPATWATLLLGMGGLGFAMRRRRKPAVRIRFV